MAFSIHPLAGFGAELRGPSLRRRLDDITLASLVDEWQRNHLLLLPDQALSERERVAFAAQLGETGQADSNVPVARLLHAAHPGNAIEFVHRGVTLHHVWRSGDLVLLSDDVQSRSYAASGELGLRRIYSAWERLAAYA
ncbi:MAG: hypothetical protein KA106_01535 [Ferrovibrio sp.]|nr:hypothetical protein [Ferrovibrio sp.]